jgi:hypothetical protein
MPIFLELAPEWSRHHSIPGRCTNAAGSTRAAPGRVGSDRGQPDANRDLSRVGQHEPPQQQHPSPRTGRSFVKQLSPKHHFVRLKVVIVLLVPEAELRCLHDAGISVPAKSPDAQQQVKDLQETKPETENLHS